MKLLLENWRKYLDEGGEEDCLLLEAREIDLLKEGVLPKGLLKKLLKTVKASLKDKGALEKILNTILKLPVLGSKVKEITDAFLAELKILKALFSEDKPDVEELEEDLDALKNAYNAAMVTAISLQTMSLGEYLKTSPKLKKYSGTTGPVLWVAMLALGIYLYVAKSDSGVLAAVVPAAFSAENIAMSEIAGYAIGTAVGQPEGVGPGRREDEQE